MKLCQCHAYIKPSSVPLSQLPTCNNIMNIAFSQEDILIWSCSLTKYPDPSSRASSNLRLRIFPSLIGLRLLFGMGWGHLEIMGGGGVKHKNGEGARM